MKKIILFFLLVPSILLADYTITEEQRKQILTQLKQDKQTIAFYQLKMSKLRQEKPQITYKVNPDGTVEETIIIPIYKDNPLEYKSTFKIKIPKKSTWFPFDLMLCGTIETASLSDIKLGITLLSFEPLDIKVLKNFRINGLVGLRSCGGSISYILPEPFNNTAIHAYSGMSYKINETFGIGVSLFF